MITDTLKQHASRLAGVSLRELVDGRDASQPGWIARAAGLELDLTKERLDAAALAALIDRAVTLGLEAQREKLLGGEVVNGTEGRPALHMAYRQGARIDGSAEADLVTRTQGETEAFARRVRSGAYAPSGKPITRVINIGIGGSDLGPRLVADALAEYAEGGPEMRFVASLDPSDLRAATSGADPEATLFVVASKSFSTQETLMSAEAARDWARDHVGAERAGAHFVAASAAPDKATAFGIDPALVFDFPDWVGGRYSVWSAVGLALEIGLGPDVFKAFRAGAQTLDAHFATAPLGENLPVQGNAFEFNRRVETVF